MTQKNLKMSWLLEGPALEKANEIREAEIQIKREAQEMEDRHNTERLTLITRRDELVLPLWAELEALVGATHGRDYIVDREYYARHGLVMMKEAEGQDEEGPADKLKSLISQLAVARG